MMPFPTAGLDVEVRQPGLPGFQMSQLWTFSCGAMSKTGFTKDSCNDMDHLQEKIRKAVASVSRVMINAIWKEIHDRLVFLRENNGDDHVEVFR